MPQKRNPDAAELIRGKTARVYGALHHLMTLTKGLPMAYNRDLQEDRHALFDAVNTTITSVRVMTGCIEGMTILEGPNLQGDLSLATELADYLAGKGVPFREAHHVVGNIVRWCEDNNRGLHQISLAGFSCFTLHSIPILRVGLSRNVLLKDVYPEGELRGEKWSVKWFSCKNLLGVDYVTMC